VEEAAKQVMDEDDSLNALSQTASSSGTPSRIVLNKEYLKVLNKEFLISLILNLFSLDYVHLFDFELEHLILSICNVHLFD